MSSSPVRSARLRRIFVAYTVNRFGTWLGVVALSLAVYDHTHSALAVSALLLAWQALPAFLVPVVVARVEASTRGHELSGLYFFEALATAAIAVLLAHFWLPAVLLLAALDGTAALAASALLRAEVARSAREQFSSHPGENNSDSDRKGAAQEAERQANATLNICLSIAFVTGPAIAGGVVAGAGASAALLIGAASFAACGAFLLDRHPPLKEAGGESVRARLHTAWTHIRESPSLRTLLLAQMVALVFIQSASPIEVIYVKVTLQGGDRGYGLLVASWGAGLVLGSLAFARASRRPLGALVSVGIVALAGAYVGFTVAPSLVVAYVAAVVGGFGNGLNLPSLISLVQRLAPPRLHGQLMGAVESLMALSLAVGLPLGGGLVAIGSPRVAFAIVGLGTAATMVAFLRVGPPSAESSRDTQEARQVTGSRGHIVEA